LNLDALRAAPISVTGVTQPDWPRNRLVAETPPHPFKAEGRALLRTVTAATVLPRVSGYNDPILTWEHIMKHNRKPFVFIRKSSCKSVFDSIYLREAVFRKAVTAADVKAGLLPRKNG
jgi:hypothetical protein